METGLQVNTVVSLKGRSWKECLWYWEDLTLCLLLRSPRKQTSSRWYSSSSWEMVLKMLFSQETVCQVHMIVLLSRWSWKGNSSQETELVKLIQVYLHIPWPGLLWDWAHWINISFTLKMVLKRPFVSDTGEDCIFIIQVSWETEFITLIQFLHRRWS